MAKDFGINFSISLVQHENDTVDCGVNYTDSDGGKVNIRKSGKSYDEVFADLTRDFMAKYYLDAAKRKEEQCKKESVVEKTESKAEKDAAHKTDIDALNARIEKLERENARLKNMRKVAQDIAHEKPYKPTKKVDGKDVPLTYGRKDRDDGMYGLLDKELDFFLKLFGI